MTERHARLLLDDFCTILINKAFLQNPVAIYGNWILCSFSVEAIYLSVISKSQNLSFMPKISSLPRKGMEKYL